MPEKTETQPKKHVYSGPDTNGCGEPSEKPISQFGISEAPKDHPDNSSGTMKVIME